MKKKIMLVDDDRNLLDSLERVLMCDEYDICTFASAAEAWKYMQTNSGEVDLVISDNKMPGVTGVDFLVALRREYPNTVRIMLTGQSDVDDARRAINEGEVYQFLMKPIAPPDMRIIVQQALSHRKLWVESKRLMKKLQKQQAVIETLERENPGITQLEKDDAGAIVINENELGDSFDDFMKKYLQE